ncbi:hypothetical protein AB7C87_18610 [Natrarchaeobius sp. A-rgal3]
MRTFGPNGGTSERVSATPTNRDRIGAGGNRRGRSGATGNRYA